MFSRLTLLFRKLFKMSDDDCYSDPYAHWLIAKEKTAAKSPSQGNVMPTANGYVPLIIEGNAKFNASDIVKRLTGQNQGYGRYRYRSRFASVHIKAEHIHTWLQWFDQLDIQFEIGTPFGSAHGISEPQSGSEDTESNSWGLESYTEEKKINPTRKSTPHTNKKKVIGIIDYGCAFANEKICLLGANPSTRVFSIWDQHDRQSEESQRINGYDSLEWASTPQYGYGVQAVRSDLKDTAGIVIRKGIDSYIRQFIHQGRIEEKLCYEYSNYPSIQNTEVTHGTYIMDFAAGVPSPLRDFKTQWSTSKDSDQTILGSDIIFVQLPRQIGDYQVSGVLAPYVLDAIIYILRATPDDADVVINLSYGGLAGPHDGSSLLERAIDELIGLRKTKLPKVKTEIVICAGNSAASDMRAVQDIAASKPASLQLSVIPDNPTLQFVEMWIDNTDDSAAEVSAIFDVIRPDGKSALNSAKVLLGSGKVFPVFNSKNEVIGQLCLPKRRAGIGNGGVRKGRGGYQALLGLYPTAYSADPLKTADLSKTDFARSQVGVWSICLDNQSARSITWHAWCERNDPVFGSGHGPRQIKFLNSTTALSTHNNLIDTGSLKVLVSGLVLNSPDFAAEYGGQGPYRRQAKSEKEPYFARDVIYAPSEENLGYWPLPGAGVYGGAKVRYSGTSVAAAVVTRALICGEEPSKLKNSPRPIKLRQRFP